MGRLSVLLVLFVLVIDQALKVWVKTHLMLGEEIVFASWFRLHFTENPGMAFGMMLPGAWGKLLLSGFRLVAVLGGIWFIRKFIREGAHPGFVAACSLILAGAIGNMIDGSIYGLIFTDSYSRVAEIFPEQGYAGAMQGLVVDMLWFPIMRGHFPEWLPAWGGEYYEFFRFIFNIADAAITVGVVIIIVFQNRFFAEKKNEAVEEAAIIEVPATDVLQTPEPQEPPQP